MADEVALIRAENEALKQQVAKLLEEKEGLRRRIDTRFDRHEITPTEVDAMKKIFESLDVDHDGFIEKSDAARLYFEMGEHLTDAEIAERLAALKTSDSGKISVDEFMAAWTAEHRKLNRYASMFKVTRSTAISVKAPSITTKTSGEPGTLQYRVHFELGGKEISPWHDISLQAEEQGAYNFVCEIPRFTRAKFEVATGEVSNPIRQDTKNAVLRNYTWGDVPFNYGMFPQTWEDPAHITEGTGKPGDNDPVDCLEIGIKQRKTGEVVPVKILGVLALIDTGETDWKVIAIACDDPLASRLHDIEDVKREMPGTVGAIREFFRVYKVCEGKPLNEFGFEGQAMNRAFALEVINETHHFWQKLQRERGQHPASTGLRCTPMLPMSPIGRRPVDAFPAAPAPDK
eukprot:TRINITY_DN6059_c0_g1_i1.p1 TRINITY_DN6059_c0_g1~~TRINITY_DN6059_c0_g1_i1.p1  ORF type:complete len:402 (-),score=94.32 TRINITY_DN6059_c0_g1_i1:66-1271(-)